MASGKIQRLRAKAKNLWNQSTETQRDLWRLGAALLVIAILAAAGFGAGRPLVRHWRHGRALEQARAFAQQHDDRNALLAMRSALELMPRDKETRMASADLLSRLGSPEAVDVREQIVVMEPDDAGARRALVREALRFGETLRAQTAMAAITADRGLEYHRLAAMLASALGQTAECKAHLAAILTADPQDAEAALDFAGLLVRGNQREEQRAGVAGLETLVKVPSVRVRAAVELLKASANQHDAAALAQRVSWLRQHLTGSEAAMASTGENAADAWVSLEEILKGRVQTPADVALLARWIGQLGQRREAVVWIESLPPTLRTDAVVMDTAAGLSAQMGDNQRLYELLETGVWGAIPPKSLMRILTSRAHQAGGSMKPLSRDVWAEAVAACGDSSSGLRGLARLAAAWGDDEGEGQILEMAVERFPYGWWAYERLRARYVANKDAVRLLRLYERWAQLAPEDAGVAASWITLSAVLDASTPVVVTRSSALYAAGPLVPASAVAQAATLWRLKHIDEALKVLEKLPNEEARKSAVSFWLGLVEADAGFREAAKESLGRVDTSAILFEENILWQKARQKSEGKSNGKK